jgi:hypothetical protein
MIEKGTIYGKEYENCIITCVGESREGGVEKDRQFHTRRGDIRLLREKV